MSESRAIDVVNNARGDPRIASVLAQAFQDDPALAWILRDPATRARVLPGFFAVMTEQSQRHGEVLASAKREAASLWYPPGTITDGPLIGLWDNLRMLGVFKTALPRGLAVAEAMYSYHPDPQPFYYLRYVGVAPDAQGKGWGGAIVRAGVARAAERGCGVLLETATPSNVAIYSRLGFAITDEWSVPGDGPQFWTMVHPAP